MVVSFLQSNEQSMLPFIKVLISLFYLLSFLGSHEIPQSLKGLIAVPATNCWPRKRTTWRLMKSRLLTKSFADFWIIRFGETFCLVTYPKETCSSWKIWVHAKNNKTLLFIAYVPMPDNYFDTTLRVFFNVQPSI